MGERKLLKGTKEYVYFDVEARDGYVWNAADWSSVKVALLLQEATEFDSEAYSAWTEAEIAPETGVQAVRLLADTVNAVTTLGTYRALIRMTPTEASAIAEHPFFEAFGHVVVRPVIRQV